MSRHWGFAAVLLPVIAALVACGCGDANGRNTPMPEQPFGIATDPADEPVLDEVDP